MIEFILRLVIENLIEAGILIIALFALGISIVSMRSDRISRQHDMLQRIVASIGNLSLKVSDISSQLHSQKSKTTQQKKQKRILLEELVNQYHYLSFLVHQGQVKDQHAYRLGGKFILKFFDKCKSIIDEEEHEDIHILVKRWKERPPDKLKNRIINRFVNYYDKIKLW